MTLDSPLVSLSIYSLPPSLPSLFFPSILVLNLGNEKEYESEIESWEQDGKESGYMSWFEDETFVNDSW
jgi:hypothetical protein